MTPSLEKRPTEETNSEMIEILDLAEKNFKVVIAMFSRESKMLIMNKNRKSQQRNYQQRKIYYH